MLALNQSIELQGIVALKFALHGKSKFELSISSKYERLKLILSVTLLKAYNGEIHSRAPLT